MLADEMSCKRLLFVYRLRERYLRREDAQTLDGR
jgi:hypothetical protein